MQLQADLTVEGWCKLRVIITKLQCSDSCTPPFLTFLRNLVFQFGCSTRERFLAAFDTITGYKMQIIVVLLLFAFCGFSICASGHTKTSKRAQIANFIAGGMAGTISSTLTIPLEVVKTQLQSSRVGGKLGPVKVFQQIMKVDGPKGFFRGIQPMLVGIIPTRAIYFWAYSTSKEALGPRLGNSPVNHLLSAFAAGITSNTVITCSIFLHCNQH